MGDDVNCTQKKYKMYYHFLTHPFQTHAKKYEIICMIIITNTELLCVYIETDS